MVDAEQRSVAGFVSRKPVAIVVWTSSRRAQSDGPERPSSECKSMTIERQRSTACERDGHSGDGCRFDEQHPKSDRRRAGSQDGPTQVRVAISPVGRKIVT
jgi:hypothetical protein